MHVIVIGAGVVGVTTAWALRARGLEVTVIEAASEPARGACFANGGQISVSHPHPWSSPQAPWIALRSLWDADAPFHWVPKVDAEEACWLSAFLRECVPARHHANTRAIAALGRHSLRVLRRWRQALELHYDAQTRGIVHLFFRKRDWQAGQAHAQELQAMGIGVRAIGRQEALRLEPALAPLAGELVGALHAYEDESGDARAFTLALAERCQAAGVRFWFNARAHGWEGLETSRPCLAVDVAGRSERVPADAFVLCAGVVSRALALPLGERLPIHPVKGYSLTVPVRDAARVPTLSLTDESKRIVASRLGNRWRIAGTAELAGFDDAIRPQRIAPLERWGKRLVGDAVDWTRAEPWAGLRPMTASGVPIIGRSRHPTVWLNTGHGSLGWTLACGSADALAALLTQATPPVEFPWHRA